MLKTDKVGKYFHQEAERFDAIYDDDKGFVEKIIDKLFRGVVRERYMLSLERMGDMNGEKVLDIGCGSGRYGISAALNGAGEVVGIDLAENMLELANQYSRDANVHEKCRWLKADYLNYDLNGSYDYILAMGFFDYITDPAPFLKKMHGHLKGTLIASFPKRWELRNFLRKFRLTLFGCGVRYYTAREIKKLFTSVGFSESNLEIRDLGRDYLVFYNRDKR